MSLKEEIINISIVIPIHNRFELTCKGITSLFQAINYYKNEDREKYRISVVVVDDGSIDGSSKWIMENYPNIHLLEGDGNLWWTGSINKGARYAIEQIKAEYVILWNDDTLCDIKYFLELAKLFDDAKFIEKSIMASKIFWIDKKNQLFNYGCYYSQKSGKKYIIGLNDFDSGQFEDIIQIQWSGGMGTIIPKHILIKTKYFDSEHFPQYHADIDFFLRAGKLGYKAYAVPTLKIYNNRESTGISKTKNLNDLMKVLFSNHSNYNIYQNYFFNLRHANSVLSWLNFFLKYLSLSTKSIWAIIWSIKIS